MGVDGERPLRQDEYALAGYVDVFEHLRAQLGDAQVRQSLRAAGPSAESVARADKVLRDSLDALRELGAGAEGTMEAIGADAGPASAQHRTALSSLADLCFVARRELQPLAPRLARNDEVATTLESVYRKLRRICARVLALLGPLVGRFVDLTDEQQEIVEVSIAVRRVYTRFRRSLVTTLTDDDSVKRALEAAAASIAQLLTHVDRTDLRLQDVMLIRGLQERIATWFRESGTPDAGRRIHADLLTTSDLLRLVNQRQELRVHDTEVIDTALGLISAGAAARETLIMMLGPLEGMDDELDALRAELARDTGDTLRAIEARLSALRTGPPEGQEI